MLQNKKIWFLVHYQSIKQVFANYLHFILPSFFSFTDTTYLAHNALREACAIDDALMLLVVLQIK